MGYGNEGGEYLKVARSGHKKWHDRSTHGLIRLNSAIIVGAGDRAK